MLSPTREELSALIDAIGGEAVLYRIVLRFYEVMSGDVLVGFFFAGRNLVEISEKQSQFLLMAAGRLRDYRGKGPATAHGGLPPILSGHFDRRLVLLRQVLEGEGLAPELVSRWVRFEESFRSVVVSQE